MGSGPGPVRPGGRVLQAGAGPGVAGCRGLPPPAGVVPGAGAAVSDRGAGVPDAGGDAGDDAAGRPDLFRPGGGESLCDEVAGGGGSEVAQDHDEDGCVEVQDGGWGAEGIDDVRDRVQPGAADDVRG